MYPKLRLGCASLVIAAALYAGVLYYGNGEPSYSELRTSCHKALSKSPHAETLDAWLRERQIPAHYELLDELGRHKLYFEGIPHESLNLAVMCARFELLRVRGIPNHYASGYFLFSADGSLVDYTISDIYFGM